MRSIHLTLFLLAAPVVGQDLRQLYDVRSYRLDLRVEPERKRLSGTVVVEATVVGDELAVLQLDMSPRLEPSRVGWVDAKLAAGSPLAGRELGFEHTGQVLRCRLDRPRAKDEVVRIAVTYSGSPRGRGFSGFHWARTKGGKPWINTSCQGPGAHSWWPCKASFFHPEDKPERLFVNLDVPAGLYGVSNGRLIGRTKQKRREIFHWEHHYPLETYSVTLNVAPYVVVERKLQLPGIERPVPFIYYVLPENAKKAKVQFAQVPQMIDAFSKAFGPFPFPESKFGLVETNFWGMEHSTAIAYGSSYPLWCQKNDVRDRFRGRNRFFDYILVHESAHEWWGNAVSASDWGHFWIHEGFGTYAEGVYVELTQGRDQAERYFASIEPMARRGRLYRGERVNSRQAYSGTIYYRGAWVLRTLRHYLADDEVWWKTLRDFNSKFRYKNASTEDFQSVLEANTGRAWGRFFKEWFYGSGSPRLEGTVKASGKTIRVQVRVSGGDFHVPLDLRWKEAGKARSRRLMLEPGENELAVPCGAKPRSLEVVDLQRVLGRHQVEVD